MKRWGRVIVLVSLFVMATSVFAATDQRGSDQSAFNRVGDWFATIGKSDTEKQAILAERQAKRIAKRAEHEARRAVKQAEKGLQNAGKELDKGAKGLGY